MQHAIELDALRSEVGAAAGPMANAVSACVHCGFCLPACPTYIELGEEMDSPRGRIVLMKEVLEGGLDLEEALDHIDPCLGCMSCVTACPSGVEYGELLMPFRELAEGGRNRSWLDRFWRGLMLDTLASPRRLRRMLRLGRLATPIRKLLPARLSAPLGLLPQAPDRAEVEFGTFPAVGERRGRVALLAGCAQQVLAPRIHRATIEVLTRSGVEVVVPKEESCCGSLAFHAGDAPRARAAAGALLRVLGPAGLLPDVDALLTNAAGCGSGLKEYGLLFAGLPEEEAARDLAGKVQDVSTFLAALDVPAPPPLAQPLRVVYHDACHLAHAQRERTAPRRLLAQIRRVTLVEPRDWQICCGSAGIYNLEEPELAARLGRRKAEALLEGEPDVIVTGNIGCLTQIESHLRRRGSAVPVRHTMEILASAHGASYPAPAR
ncbi:MAG: 4Fe-4S dicluster domain-containing protein [Holophagales bacterium]|nr:4Fe-4S dicluster domain-containing protein [Holophagales bacterium]MYF05845.1 4Fe-4S dicluster domain-containing protein [Holophagales bacterium]MYJ26764.1 4Fe-4S dicluster domain-containing protein [Holophagales bacterium]